MLCHAIDAAIILTSPRSSSHAALQAKAADLLRALCAALGDTCASYSRWSIALSWLTAAASVSGLLARREAPHGRTQTAIIHGCCLGDMLLHAPSAQQSLCLDTVVVGLWQSPALSHRMHLHVHTGQPLNVMQLPRLAFMAYLAGLQAGMTLQSIMTPSRDRVL